MRNGNEMGATGGVGGCELVGGSRDGGGALDDVFHSFSRVYPDESEQVGEDQGRSESIQSES